MGSEPSCETRPPPVGAVALIDGNKISECPEGEVLAGSEPHLFCTTSSAFIDTYGYELYNYVYGGN